LNWLLNHSAQTILTLLLTVLMVVVCSCQPFYMPSLFGVPPARVAQEQHAVPTATSTPNVIAHETLPPEQPPKEETETRIEESARPTATPARAETKPPQLAVVSNPAEQAASRQRAEQAVDKAVKRLATVDRSKLSGQDASDYDVIAGFIKDAQRALREQDFVRAEGLARKAQVLASQLGSRPPSPH
jgi:uncharacterized protein (DUF885 family)